jgi:hypothetical protein
MSMPRARNTDPGTSHEAADSVRNIRETQQKILSALRQSGPMTDEQIFDVLTDKQKLSPSGARTRRCELVRLNLVEDSGERLLTKSNRRTIVWRAIEPSTGGAT